MLQKLVLAPMSKHINPGSSAGKPSSKRKLREAVVARFRFTEKGVRMAHNGDPVIDKKGRVIGVVTSCAVDTEGYLTGQASLEDKYAVEGTPISVFQGSPKNREKHPQI